MANTSNVRGLQKALNFYANRIDYLNKKVPSVLQKRGNKMVEKARKDHKYKTKSGQLERSIEANVNSRDWSLIFEINPDRVTNNDYNYAMIQHEGSGQGYKKSYMAKAVKPKLKSGGVKADHFMVRAFESEFENLRGDIIKVLGGKS